MNIMELVAVLTLDNAKYLKGLNDSESKAKSFGGKLAGGLGKVAKVGAAALTAAGSASTAFMTKSVKAGADFDNAMSQVYATLGDKAEAVVQQGEYAGKKSSEALRDFAQKMGASTQYTAKQSADALNYMALAGYDAATSMDMLPNVMNLAAAGSFDLARASDMLTDTQTALGWSLDRTKQAVDEWAKAASTGNTSVEQMGDAFLVVGGLAQELNGGMIQLEDGTEKAVDGTQELEIALTAMANAGVKGSEAGTHMRNMLLKLADPTDEGVARLESMGVAVFDTEGKMRSLADIFGDLSTAMGKMTQESKIQTISALFNTRDMASAEALLNAVNQDWDAIGASITDAEGAAQKMADTQLDNLAGDVTKFTSALEGAEIALSDKVSPALRTFVQTGTEGLSEFTKKLKSGDFVGATESIGNALGEAISKAVTKIPKLLQAGAGLLKGIVEGIVKSAPSAFESLKKSFTSMFGGLTGAIDEKAPDLIEKGLEWLEKVSGAIRENFGTIVSAVLDVILHVAQAIADSIPAFVERIPTIISNIAGIINDNAPKIVVAAVRIIAAIAVGLVKAIPTLILNIPKILKAIWDVFMAFNWLALGKQIIVAIVNGIKSLATSIPTMLKGIGKKAGSALMNGGWRTIGKNIITLIGKGISALARLPFTLMRKTARLGMKAFTGIAWGNVGKNIIRGIVRGITAIGGTIADKLLGLVQTAWQKVTGWLQERSPSRRFMKVGKNIGLGMAIGIENTTGEVEDAMAGMYDAFEAPDFDAVVPEITTEPVGYPDESAWEVLATPDTVTSTRNDEPRDVTVILQLDRTQLARTVFRLNNEETQRVGVNLAGGFA